MRINKPLPPKDLRQSLKLSDLKLPKDTSKKNTNTFIGQKRALEALHFGIHIHKPGYNLYAMGPDGIGKFALISTTLESFASKIPPPSDWCYLYNFETEEKPIPLQLPRGVGKKFQHDMVVLVQKVGDTILSVFESDRYASKMKSINLAYSYNGQQISKETVIKAKLVRRHKMRHEKVKALQVKSVKAAIKPIFEKYKKKYKKFSGIKKYLTSALNDILVNYNTFVKVDDKTNLLTFSVDDPDLIRYKVNLFVDNSATKHAPVVFEETPNYSHVICRVEHITHMGTLVTNFTLIRPGALHKANGGFLIIEMDKLKKNKHTWEALKNALYNKAIKIEPIQNISYPVKTVSLEPLSIPLNVKVILIGNRNTYYYLSKKDPNFLDLFKVPVDFDEQIERNPHNLKLFARMVDAIIKKEGLRPFNLSAIGAIINQSTRLAEDINKLSNRMREIVELILESNYWAGVENKKKVDAVHVNKAINSQIHRMDRTREIYYEEVARNFIIIKTSGKAVGQINCLSVRKVGSFAYGHPTRVTARVSVGTGKGKLLDIQTEIKLAGPFHTKAGLIIANFLQTRFTPEQFIALSASISFEQIYCWTDGDSASVGELCALLSAFSEIPIKQNLAVTGSIDQYGEVQAVGGINEKIEGFFDVCKSKGLTGNQGVLIPEINKKNLMLKEEVVTAAKAKKFFVFAISHVDEAITQLTGVPAGRLNRYGKYTKDSVYDMIQKRLQKITSKNN